MRTTMSERQSNLPADFVEHPHIAKRVLAGQGGRSAIKDSGGEIVGFQAVEAVVSVDRPRFARWSLGLGSSGYGQVLTRRRGAYDMEDGILGRGFPGQRDFDVAFGAA